MNNNRKGGTVLTACGVALALLFGAGRRVDGETARYANVLGYTGYLSTPSAYIEEGKLRFSYSYLSRGFPLNRHYAKKDSEFWVFASSLGMFPFLEVYFSVYVLPSDNISDKIPNYGANKWRTAGAKIILLGERHLLPAVAVGLADPDPREFGAKLAAPNIPSRFIVMSKTFLSGNGEFSAGYGVKNPVEQSSRWRLGGLFGGGRVRASRHISFLADYDGDIWHGGVSVGWRRASALVSVARGKRFAVRMEYGAPLL